MAAWAIVLAKEQEIAVRSCHAAFHGCWGVGHRARQAAAMPRFVARCACKQLKGAGACAIVLPLAKEQEIAVRCCLAARRCMM